MYVLTEEFGNGKDYRIISKHNSLEEAQVAHAKIAKNKKGVLYVNANGFPPYGIRRITSPTTPKIKKVKKGELK